MNTQSPTPAPSSFSCVRIPFPSYGLIVLAFAFGLSGCASSGGDDSMLGKALEVVGLKKPDAPEGSKVSLPALPQPTRITLRLHAAEFLNTDASGKSLSLVARIYRLRASTAFVQAPYDAFKEAEYESRLLGNDVLDVREVVLTPGQKYEVIETLPPDATHFAVVGLLRAPDPQRWKFVFDAKEAARTGVTLGAHACALSVAEGDPVGAPQEARRLAGMRCP